MIHKLNQVLNEEAECVPKVSFARKTPLKPCLYELKLEDDKYAHEKSDMRW